MELLTGRTHQIRGQLAAEGCPIYGDHLYGPGALLQNDRSPFLQPLCGQETTPVAQQLGADNDGLGSNWLVDFDVEDAGKGYESRRLGPDSFTTSPGLALQAHHISLELEDGVLHAFTLDRDTCWWAHACGAQR